MFVPSILANLLFFRLEGPTGCLDSDLMVSHLYLAAVLAATKCVTACANRRTACDCHPRSVDGRLGCSVMAPSTLYLITFWKLKS